MLRHSSSARGRQRHWRPGAIASARQLDPTARGGADAGTWVSSAPAAERSRGPTVAYALQPHAHGSGSFAR
jgi:hypothetical protein